MLVIPHEFECPRHNVELLITVCKALMFYSTMHESRGDPVRHTRFL